MTTLDRAVSIHPYWKIREEKFDEFKRLSERFLAAASTEPGCLYYGFSFNEADAFCREAYDSAEGVLEHLSNVGPLLAEALTIAQITRLEIHGPEEELAKLRTPLSAFNPIYFTLLSGRRR